jgi:predicted nuclease with TOPRIM domain
MAKTLCENKKIIETMATELDELRKHEVEWHLAQARIKELEAEKNAKNEKIDTLYQKSLARLEELVNKKYPDEEEDHAEADGILCDMLNALGYKDLTDAWDKIGKWYS